MRRKKILELPFLHSNLKGRVLYLEYINPKLISIDSRNIEPLIETPKIPLPFKVGDYDSFYIDCSKGHNDIGFLLAEVARISRPGSVILLKLFEGEQYPKLIEELKQHEYIFDKSIKVPYLRKFWGPKKIYTSFNLFKLVGEQPQKKISVVIPMYNAEKTIVKALKSIEAQTYPIHEVVIIDDESCDSSVDKVKEFANTSRLNIKLHLQKNGGPSKARNEGIRKTSGEMVAFLDSDDSWGPEKVDVQVRILESLPNAGLVSCNRNKEHFPRFLIFGFGDFVRLPLKLHLIKNFCPTPTVLVHKSILEKEMFDESMRHLEDLDLWVRISKKYDCYLLNRSLAWTGDGKPNFGHSGLSKNLCLMEKGELKCIFKVWSDRSISFFEYVFFSIYSVLKFLRRIFIVLKRA